VVTRLETTYSTINWSSDGALVTKTRLPAPNARRRFRNELRVNLLLNSQRPPVATPALVEHDTRRLSLTFVAVPGEPIGPKYPRELPADQLGATVALAKRLRSYNPRRRWLRRFDSARRLELARRAGLLTDEQTSGLLAVARRVHTRLRFAHGDVTARNVMHDHGEFVLIDWEWAGLYPDGYELAFLWFTLVDLEQERARVEALVDTDKTAFLLSALLIQLWHLQWFLAVEFREKHLGTRDDLIARLIR
jgi:Tfp pilus assembly protein PilN